MSVIICKGSFMQHRTFMFSFYPKFKTQLLYTECVSAEIPYTWKHNSGFFTSYASTSQPSVAFLNLYETERTSDSAGKILWPCHLNVYHTRANPKYSRISLAMFKLLNMWAKAKDDNLKLQDKIPNFEQKKINHLKRKVHKVFGVIFALSFGCSKPSCLSSANSPTSPLSQQPSLYFIFNIIDTSLQPILVKHFLCLLYENKRAASCDESIFILYQQSKVVSNSICHTSHSPEHFLNCDFS